MTTKSERCLVVGIETAGPKTLFIEIFVGHNNDQKTARPDQLPPLLQRFDRIRHVLEAVAAMHSVIVIVRTQRRYLRCITVFQIKGFGPAADRISSASNVNHATAQVGLGELRAADFHGLAAFIHLSAPSYYRTTTRLNCQGHEKDQKKRRKVGKNVIERSDDEKIAQHQQSCHGSLVARHA